jgi:hypothetical protein
VPRNEASRLGRSNSSSATVASGRSGGYRRREGMSDRRYSTARWQRLRKAVLAHYGHVCQIQGPRCAGYASTVHHLVPSSSRPPRTRSPGDCSLCVRSHSGATRSPAPVLRYDARGRPVPRRPQVNSRRSLRDSRTRYFTLTVKHSLVRTVPSVPTTRKLTSNSAPSTNRGKVGGPRSTS